MAHVGDAARDVLNLTIKESAEPVQRLRLSELFGPDGRILPYSFPNALGTQILLVLDRVSSVVLAIQPLVLLFLVFLMADFNRDLALFVL